MNLTPDNQDEMDCRPLGRKTGVRLSEATLANLSADRPESSPKPFSQEKVEDATPDRP